MPREPVPRSSRAGRRLAEDLDRYQGRDDLIVLGLARGGVPVAYEVARALHAPLDVLVVRKVSPPGHEELALGALASGGYRFVNEEMVQLFGFAPEQIDELATREQAELERQEHELRGDRPLPDVKGKTVILVDDGLATGASMCARRGRGDPGCERPQCSRGSRCLWRRRAESRDAAVGETADDTVWHARHRLLFIAPASSARSSRHTTTRKCATRWPRRPRPIRAEWIR
jgi:adenine/guanine phosphoribosyltransferase-like PRPP-binding protein